MSQTCPVKCPNLNSMRLRFQLTWFPISGQHYQPVAPLVQNFLSSSQNFIIPLSTMALSDLRSRSLVLGTSSKYRHSLFRTHFPSLPFTTRSANLDEYAITAGYVDRAKADPEALTLALANAKASALLPDLPPASILLTSDQVVSYRGIIREKPGSVERCKEYLRSYAEYPLVTVTAVVLVDSDTGRRVEGVDVASQLLHPIPEEVVDRLVEKGEVLHCAGGITVEDSLLKPYLKSRTGSLESIMGLPIGLVTKLLSEV